MSEITIENPAKEITYQLTWNEFKDHISKTVAKFPKEYSIVKENEEDQQILVLYRPLSSQGQNVVNDLLIYISATNLNANATTVNAVASNESLNIVSYTELDRHNKSLSTFLILLDKSIKGTLNAAIVKPKPQLTPQAVVQILVTVAALAAICYGLIAVIR